MMGTLDPVRSRAIECQIATEYGRDRIAKALYEVIHDGLEFGPRGAIAIPIQEATEVALHVLAWRLAQVLERAPNGLPDRFHASHRWVELGWE